MPYYYVFMIHKLLSLTTFAEKLLKNVKEHVSSVLLYSMMLSMLKHNSVMRAAKELRPEVVL